MLRENFDSNLIGVAFSNLMEESTSAQEGNVLPQTDECSNTPLSMEVDREFIQVSRKRGSTLKDSSNMKVKVVENLSRSDDDAVCPSTISTDSSESDNQRPRQIIPHKVNYLYSANDKASYAVYAYSDKFLIIHFSVLSKIVSEIANADIVSIKRLDSGKAIVEVKSAEANRLVTNTAFVKYKIEVFIPSYRVLRTGIVKGIDQSLSSECIKDNIRSSARILEVQRLNRLMTINNQVSYIPSRTLCIKFAGQSLPREISLFNAKYIVEPQGQDLLRLLQSRSYRKGLQKF